MELAFANDLDSAKLLDSIMNGYPGRNCGTIFADQGSMTAMLFFLERKIITVTEHTYPYNQDIRENREMMELYTELAQETRWKQFGHTEIEGLRVNALRVLLEEGEPSYDDFICYREGRICVHCGNLELHPLLMYLADHEQVEQFYIFPYPYRTEDRTAKYHRFAISKDGIAGAKAYREYVWDRMREVSQKSGVSSVLPKLEEEHPLG